MSNLVYVGIIIIVILLGIIIHNLRAKSQRKVKNPSTYGKQDGEPQQSHVNMGTQTDNQIHLNNNNRNSSLNSQQQQSPSSNLSSSIKSALNNLNDTLNKNLNGGHSDSNGNTPQIISPATIIIGAVVLFIILPMMFSMTYNALNRTLKRTTQPIERFNHRVNEENTVTKPTQAIYDEEDPQIKPDMVRQGHLVNGLENLQDQRSKALGILLDRQGKYISSDGHTSLYITKGANDKLRMIIARPNTQTPIENAQITSCRLGQHAGVIISGINYEPIHNNPKNLKANSFQDLIIFNRNNKNLEITRDTYPMLNQNQPTESQGSNLVSTKIDAQRFTYR